VAGGNRVFSRGNYTLEHNNHNNAFPATYSVKLG
jgi:hypothetical protein